MPGIALKDLAAMDGIGTIRIHAIEGGVYVASAAVDGDWRAVEEEEGRTLRTYSLVAMQQALDGVGCERQEICHLGVYDELGTLFDPGLPSALGL